METKKIISGLQAGKSLIECQRLLRNQGIRQPIKAGKDIYNNGIYIRGRNYRPIEGQPLHKDIYILTPDGIKTLCYNTRPHRAVTALKLYFAGKLGNVDDEIWNNYITNGHNTRRGLLANYSPKQINRISSIARSHANYMGKESGNARIDHNNRMNMRN
jgi:hypothetical protein